MNKYFQVELFSSWDVDYPFTYRIGVKYPTLESAQNAAWCLVECFAKIHDLDYENQGDLYMAYFKNGHPRAGEGAITAEIYDQDGNQIDDI